MLHRQATDKAVCSFCVNHAIIKRGRQSLCQLAAARNMPKDVPSWSVEKRAALRGRRDKKIDPHSMHRFTIKIYSFLPCVGSHVEERQSWRTRFNVKVVEKRGEQRQKDVCFYTHQETKRKRMQRISVLPQLWLEVGMRDQVRDANLALLLQHPASGYYGMLSSPFSSSLLFSLVW